MAKRFPAKRPTPSPPAARGPAKQKKLPHNFTCIISREGDGFVSHCPGLDIASQGETVEEAREQLREAIALFLACASESEIKRRIAPEVYVSAIEVQVG